VSIKDTWRWIERRLALARGAREEATKLGADSDTAWSILELAADVENEARQKAFESGCETHIFHRGE